jgi:hypothetical protein
VFSTSLISAHVPWIDLNSLTTQDQYAAQRITEVMYGLSQAGDIDPGQVLLKNSSFNHFSATRWYSGSLR